MKVKLISKNILNYLYTENELADFSIMESFYTIRKLKSVIYSLENDYIEVSEPKENGQVYCEQFKIWFNINDYKIL